MVFGKELVKAVINNVAIVGIVIALIDLKPMDMSGNTGQSYKLDSEDQIITIGKSEDLVFCKGAPKDAMASALPVMSLGLHLQCHRFLNKAHEITCSDHTFMKS